MANNRLFNQGKFTFIGDLVSAKEPMTRKKSENNDWWRTKLGIGIKSGTSSQYLTMEYPHNDKVTTCKLLGKDSEMFEVNLSETKTAETMAKVAEISKITIDLETDQEKKKEYTSLIFKVRTHEREIEEIMKKEPSSITEADKVLVNEKLTKIDEYKKQIEELATNRVQFCHMQDVIPYLNSKLPELAGKKLKVTGNVKSNYYKGNNTLQYIPSFIEVVPNETESQLKAYLDIFYDKDGITDDTKAKKMIVNGYVGERVRKQDRLFPVTITLDYTRVDETIELHQQLLEFMKDTFRITDKKQIHKNRIEVNLINGAEVVEFTMDCLTDMQKRAVMFGKAKLEDFKPRGNVYGARVQELRLEKPVLKDEFSDGSIEVFPVKELDTYLVADDSDVKIADVKEEKKEETTTGANDAAAMMKSLFGV